MTFENLLKTNNIQKQIDKLAKTYKNKKVVIYGTGLLSREIFANHDLSSLNIVGVVNIKYGSIPSNDFMFQKTIRLNDLLNIDFDVVLIANEDYKLYRLQLENFLFKNNFVKRIKIKPIVKLKKRNADFVDAIGGFVYTIVNPEELVKSVANFIANINSFYILPFRLRESKRRKLFNSYLNRLYGYQVSNFAKSIGKNLWCRNFSKVTRNTVLGDNVHLNGISIQGKGKVTIGNYFHSGKGCLIISDNHNYDNGNAIPYDNYVIERDVIIGDFVWFGANVTILPSTHIGEGVIVQAGSVVHGKIPNYAIIGGNPAEIIKYRDIEHFKELKDLEKFH